MTATRLVDKNQYQNDVLLSIALVLGLLRVPTNTTPLEYEERDHPLWSPSRRFLRYQNSTVLVVVRLNFVSLPCGLL